MPWRNTVVLADLQFAMNQCDQMGLDAFRSHYGFRPANGIRMTFPGRNNEYEARPLIAAAYSHQFPNAQQLQPINFDGNNAHNFLERNGFLINHF